MRFKSQKALNQLLTHGIVATMRDYESLPQRHVIINGKHLGFLCTILPTTEENIRKYYKLSGFSTPEEWINEAKKLHHGKLPKYIFIIELVKKDFFKR